MTKKPTLLILLGSLVLLIYFSVNSNEQVSCEESIVDKIYKELNRTEKQNLNTVKEEDLIYLTNTTFGKKIYNIITLNNFNKIFNKKGVFDSNYMVYYVIKLLKKKSENDVKKSEIFNEFKDNCDFFKKNNRKKNSKFKIGEIVHFREKIERKTNRSSPIECLYESDWIFSRNDLIVTAKVLKNNICYNEIQENVFMKVKILKFNSIWNNQLSNFKINDTIELNILYDIIYTNENKFMN